MNTQVNYFEAVRKWADDRNITEGSTVQAQTLKFIEEVGEFVEELGFFDAPRFSTVKNNQKVCSELGDVLVVGTILLHQLGNKPIEKAIGNCINHPREVYKPTHFNIIASLSELCGSVSKNKNPSAITDAILQIIDLCVDLYYEKNNLVMGNDYLSFKFLNQIIEIAYDKIKDRKGKMINGVFVKEQDLTE